MMTSQYLQGTALSATTLLIILTTQVKKQVKLSIPSQTRPFTCLTIFVMQSVDNSVYTVSVSVESSDLVWMDVHLRQSHRNEAEVQETSANDLMPHPFSVKWNSASCSSIQPKSPTYSLGASVREWVCREWQVGHDWLGQQEIFLADNISV